MSQDQPNNSRRESRPWTVWLALAAAAAIFVLSASVIYYRFMTTPETDCSVIVSGNPSLDGYSVTVERITSDLTKKRNLSDTLNKTNLYNARFFIPSGTYRVEVWDTQSSRIEAQSDFIPPRSRFMLDLNRKYPMPTDKPNAPTSSPR